MVLWEFSANLIVFFLFVYLFIHFLNLISIFFNLFIRAL